MSPLPVLPVINLSHASAHSRTMSVAYLFWGLAAGTLSLGGPSNSLLVLALAREGELILRLPVRDLVDAEPLVGGAQEAREVPLDVLDVVQLRGERVVDVDDHDLPVRLLLVEERHHAQDLDLLDLAGLRDQLADLADVQRVVVTLCLGLRVDNVGIFPCLALEWLADGIFFFVSPQRRIIPGGRHRSSTDTPYEGSSF